MRSLVIAVTFLCFVATGFAQECIPADANFVYPALARSARVTGDVTVYLSIGADGIPVVTGVDGHPLFKEAVTSGSERLRYPIACAGKQLDLKLSYRIDSGVLPPTKVTRVGPNQFEIISDPFQTVDYWPSIHRKHFWSRIFRWKN